MSQVIVKRLSTGSRIVLKSHYGYEIDKVNIFQDQYLVASTSETILIGDLATCKLSEIPWTGSGKEKYYFENPLICMVFNAGELSLVEYGVNEVLGSCRTEHMNPHLISVRLNERKCAQDVKLIAFLVDLLTVNIVDLISGSIVASISHDEKVDWLELSGQGKKLLFRDKKRQLHIFDIATQTRTTLLGYCTYVQWVPNSDVVVAQSRGNLCIWYSIDSPERVTLFPIKGEIEDIERVDGKTEVIVDEGVNTVSYTLDEGLIEFGTAIEDHDYDRAINLLESLELTSETEAMWNSLAQTALADRKLHIAERCYAALGDVSKTRYLNVLKSSLGTSGNDSIDSFQNALVRAKLAVLDKQFKLAESIYLEQGKVDEAMAMYQEMHKWDMSIKVAETKNHPDLEHLKKNYFQWLVESGQEEAAGSWKEEERDYSSAISLYLKGGMPSRAAAALDLLGIHNARDQADRVASALYQSSMFENAGSLYEKLGNNEKALEAYRKGRSYRLAVELARLVFPDQVVKLEEQWGDYLVSQKQLDSAVNHFIEAGKSVKAIDAAIASKQFKKAVSIVDTLSPRELAKPYFVPLAKYFSQTKDFEQAEHFYVAAGRPQDAVDMYTKSNKWDKAHRLAVSYMSQEEVSVLYLCQAKDLEIHGKFKDAEVLYLTIKEPDLAINMYKKHKQYENMVRLVAVYHKDLLDETHLFLAKTLEADASYGQAEKHYVEGKDWKSVINMYCVNNLYEEAYRAGKTYGGPNSAKQVAYMWARSLGGEAAVKLLCKLDLLDAALDFATENGAFDFAFELSRFAGKYKIEEIHYKHAMYLEDEGKFKEAECAFILAGKPREAILMFIHNEDWDKALKVAEEYEPASVVDVLVGQAKLLFTHNDHVKGESLILRAQKPELAITWYKESDNWKEALRFCKQHIPAKLSEISAEYDLYLAGKTDSGRDHLLATALQYEKQNDYIRAIEIYLKLNSNHTNNLDLLEKKWCRAVELALKFVPDNVASVVAQACKQLVDIGRHTAAGDMYFSLDMHKEAIIAFAAGGLWDRANAVAAVAPKYQEYLDAIYLKSLKTSGNDDIMLGDSSKALEVYADRGDWTKCLEIAKLQNDPELLAKFLSRYTNELLHEGQSSIAAEIIAKYGSPAHPLMSQVYNLLSEELLRSASNEYVNVLRAMLSSLVAQQNFKIANSEHLKISKCLMIAQFLHQRAKCAQNADLAVIGAKLALSVLRYTDKIPADAAFYEAGQLCKNVGMLNMAFVCWNRFLDLSEAIDEGDTGAIDNGDFLNTDIPFDSCISRHYVEASKRELVSDWVLQMSLDQNLNQEIDMRPCESCAASIYSANLVCPSCKVVSEPCCVTGFPVLQSSVNCTSCRRPANKDDWNKYVLAERACPVCRAAQVPIYFST